MKGLSLLSLSIILSFAGVAFADSAQLLIDGAKQEEHVGLHSSVSHTETWTTTESDTCWTQECSGSRPVCHSESACRPLPTGGESCRSEEVCNGSEPVCHSVSYSCTREVSHSRQVHDFDTKADVTIHVGPAPVGVSLHELVNVNLNGESVSVTSSRTSQQVLIFARDNTQGTMVAGGLKALRSDVFLRFMNREAALTPLSGGMQNLVASQDKVSFSVGATNDKTPLTIALQIKKQKLFFGGKVLINRSLNAHEFLISHQGDRTLVTIDLQKLGVSSQLQRGSKYEVEASAILDLNSAGLVNREDVPNLKMSQKVRFKN